ncbi:hypothetical protein PPACK8108_LOCUS6230 [Phakopsora pachyrhizi]|uniref:Uncharacterized protein n=1 Tax=Phakopsora pachyrhizi TaxID=170000 RepID=A0AAV0AQG7_PHAPC|nr:hypothetical protein PPACK8108_LOCUS6230 [Phakopsora pachyrhizi]
MSENFFGSTVWAPTLEDMRDAFGATTKGKEHVEIFLLIAFYVAPGMLEIIGVGYGAPSIGQRKNVESRKSVSRGSGVNKGKGKKDCYQGEWLFRVPAMVNKFCSCKNLESVVGSEKSIKARQNEVSSYCRMAFSLPC